MFCDKDYVKLCYPYYGDPISIFLHKFEISIQIVNFGTDNAKFL